MIDQAVDDAPTLLTAEPQLFVSSIEKSCAFFEKTLGFAVQFTYGTPPFYAQVARDNARLNLRHVDRPVIDPSTAAANDLLSATVVIDHAKPLFLEFQAAGVDFHQGLRTEPWGARTFIVKDPDGNLIAFAADGN